MIGLPFFFWPLCWLPVDLQLLITSLASLSFPCIVYFTLIAEYHIVMLCLNIYIICVCLRIVVSNIYCVVVYSGVQHILCGCGYWYPTHIVLLRIVVSNTYCDVAHSGVQHIVCCVIACFPSSCVPYVTSFSGLYFNNCPFGIR